MVQFIVTGQHQSIHPSILTICYLFPIHFFLPSSVFIYPSWGLCFILNKNIFIFTLYSMGLLYCLCSKYWELWEKDLKNAWKQFTEPK